MQLALPPIGWEELECTEQLNLHLNPGQTVPSHAYAFTCPPSPTSRAGGLVNTGVGEQPLLEQHEGKWSLVTMATQRPSNYLGRGVTWQPAPLAFQCQIPERHTVLSTAGTNSWSVTKIGADCTNILFLNVFDCLVAKFRRALSNKKTQSFHHPVNSWSVRI